MPDLGPGTDQDAAAHLLEPEAVIDLPQFHADEARPVLQHREGDVRKKRLQP